MGREISNNSFPEPSALLLRLRRIADGPESAVDRRAAMPRLPVNRQPAPWARRGTCAYSGRRGGVCGRQVLRADWATRVFHGFTAAPRRVEGAGEPGRGAETARAAVAVRGPHEKGNEVQAAGPRRRPLLAARRPPTRQQEPGPPIAAGSRSASVHIG